MSLAACVARASSSARISSSRRWPRTWPALTLSPGTTRHSSSTPNWFAPRREVFLYSRVQRLSRMSVARGEFRDEPVSSPPRPDQQESGQRFRSVESPSSALRVLPDVRSVRAGRQSEEIRPASIPLASQTRRVRQRGYLSDVMVRTKRVASHLEQSCFSILEIGASHICLWPRQLRQNLGHRPRKSTERLPD